MSYSSYRDWRPGPGAPPAFQPVGGPAKAQPAPSYAPSYTSYPGGGGMYPGGGGLMDGPGHGERWYEQNKHRFGQPSQYNQWLSGVQGSMQGGRVPPRGTQAAWNSAYPFLSQTGAGTTNARNISQQLWNPGAGEQAARGAQQFFTNPGAGEQYAQQMQGYWRNTGALENYYGNYGGYFTSMGEGERNALRSLGGFEQPGVAEGNYANARNALGQIRYGDQAIGHVADGTKRSSSAYDFNQGMSPFVTASPVRDEYSYFAPGLRGQSYSEQIFGSGAGGLIDPYARAQEKQTRRIRDAAAARGQFNTGASMRLEEELGADIAAQEAKDRIALAGQADQARLGRAGMARDYATAIGAEEQGRRALGLQAATAADESTRANLGLGLQAYGMASDEAFKRVGMETEAADIAQRAAIDRLFRGGQLGLQADEQGLRRMLGGAQVAGAAQGAADRRVQGGYDMASSGQRLGMDRERAYVDLGRLQQELEQGRLGQSASLGLGADAAELARIQALFAGGGALDTAEDRAIRTASDIYSTADRTDMDRMRTEADISAGIQRLYEGRERGALQDMAGQANAMAQFLINNLTAADQQALNLKLSALKADLAAGKISQEQYDDMANSIMESYRAAAQTLAGPKAAGAGGKA
jgi:hypothetical protein